ncbi:MAG: anaerobic sulfatase maturase [SAR324 cluster bacterium]|nr:anaerobic sulfatase maturase [SAR324 cluster bacterium]
MPELRSILIKPMGSFCNIKCDYCFYLDKHSLYPGGASTHRMNETTLETLIKGMFDCTDSPVFVWQGGEPTVLGLEFFKNVTKIQKHYAQNRPYQNSLQTNGILLNEAWAQFLRQENFLVGISLDGPQHIHDHYRKDHKSKGTFQPVFEKAQMLLKHEVPVNVLATVTDYSVKHAKEIYDFFAENGFLFMQFSPVVERDPQNPEIAASFSVTAQDYGYFLYELMTCWINDFDFKTLKQKTSIRFFDSVLAAYIGLVPDHCVMHKVCNDYLVVEHNGDLYSCDFLVSENTKLGNLHEISLKEAFHSPAHIAFGAQKAVYVRECQQCQWLRLCYGGCIKDRRHDPKDQGHNHFCESYKYFFKQAHSHFKKFASLYHQYY